MSSDLLLLPNLAATPYRFLWHSGLRTALLADLHLGALETWLHRQAPVGPTESAWQRLLARDPAQVILAGDIFDDPLPSPAAVQHCRNLLGSLPPTCQVTITPGNHDPADIDRLLGVATAPEVRIGPYLISHGHVIPSSLHDSPHITWIVGHQHPAVTFRTRAQSAKMACYALCQSTPTRPGILLLPAFSREVGGPLGSNLRTPSHWLLPVPHPAPVKIRVFGLIEPADAEPQVLDFGPLSLLP